MADIRHKLVIKVNPQKVYEAVTTQEGIESWWCRNTSAKPAVGFTNSFVFGQVRNDFKVTALVPGKKVEWECIESNEEWMGTTVTFDLEEKSGNTVLRFVHGNWQSVTDFFDACSYDWAIFLKSLKSFCE